MGGGLAFNFSSVLKTGEEALDREKCLDTCAVIRGSQGYEMEEGKKPWGSFSTLRSLKIN